MDITTEELFEQLEVPLLALIEKLESRKLPKDTTVGFCREGERGDDEPPRVIVHCSGDGSDSGYMKMWFSFEAFIEEAWDIYSCGDYELWAEKFPEDCERLAKLLLEKAEAVRKEARESEEEDPEA